MGFEIFKAGILNLVAMTSKIFMQVCINCKWICSAFGEFIFVNMNSALPDYQNKFPFQPKVRIISGISSCHHKYFIFGQELPYIVNYKAENMRNKI